MTFSSPGYSSIEYLSNELPLRNGLLEVKLELENGRLRQLGLYRTGVQPKSAYFTNDGRRLIVPLLGERGVDVFRVEAAAASASLVFEQRLLPPGGGRSGNVEALVDHRRNEIWISNMEENMVHIYDLHSLAHKTSLSTGGVFPKVIVQNPAGNLTLVSNWVSHNITVFNSDTKELLHRIPVGGTPRGMTFSPDGQTLYVAIYDEALIAVVDMVQMRVRTTYRLYEGQGAARHIIYNDGKLYVSDMFRGTVNIVDAVSGALLVSRRIGPNINTIVLSPCGSYVFASSRGRNNPVDYTRPGPDFGAVYMLRSDNLNLIERVWGRNQPTGLAISPDGSLMVFTNFLDANLELYFIGD